jgi:hypothetical protein
MCRPTHSPPLHNPYTLPYLAFLVERQNASSDPFSSSAINTYHLSIEGFNILSSVELNTQTVDPVISLALTTPIMLLLAASSIFIQVRTLQMLKRERSVNNSLMVTQAKIHIIFWPFIVIVNVLIENIYPLSAYTTTLFCTILSFILYLFMLSIILYSFYAAILRYLFCLHTERVEKFGKTKLITLTYWIFYLHTITWTLSIILTRFNLDHVPLINSCYGWQDQVYLLELDDGANMAKRHFCALSSGNGKKMQFLVV